MTLKFAINFFSIKPWFINFERFIWSNLKGSKQPILEII